MGSAKDDRKLFEVSFSFLWLYKLVLMIYRILFREQDLSRVKEYCCDSWSKLLDSKVSIQDFIFAKEVRMGTYRYLFFPP